MLWWTDAPNIVKVAVLCLALVLASAVPQLSQGALIIGIILLLTVAIEIHQGVQLT